MDASWVEPVTLLVTLLSSVAVTALAQWAPPIGQLNLPQTRELIAYSNPEIDWLRLELLQSQTMAYKAAESLRIIFSYEQEMPDFIEDWIPKTWNGVNSFYVQIVQAGEMLFEMRLLSVDSGRGVLPLPGSAFDLRVTRLQDTLARIMCNPSDPKDPAHRFYSYDGYFHEAGFVVIESCQLKVNHVH